MQACVQATTEINGERSGSNMSTASGMHPLAEAWLAGVPPAIRDVCCSGQPLVSGKAPSMQVIKAHAWLVGPATQMHLQSVPGIYALEAALEDVWKAAQFPCLSEKSSRLVTAQFIKRYVQFFRGAWRDWRRRPNRKPFRQWGDLEKSVAALEHWRTAELQEEGEDGDLWGLALDQGEECTDSGPVPETELYIIPEAHCACMCPLCACLLTCMCYSKHVYPIC